MNMLVLAMTVQALPLLVVAKQHLASASRTRTTTLENKKRDRFSASFSLLDSHRSMTRVGSTHATLQLLLRCRITLQLSDLVRGQVVR